jgi:hypothetical protein
VASAGDLKQAGQRVRTSAAASLDFAPETPLTLPLPHLYHGSMARVATYWLDDRRPGGFTFSHQWEGKDCPVARNAEQAGSARAEGDGGFRLCSICAQLNALDEAAKGQGGSA